ncbi:MAG: glycosyltransferase family 39 protein [Bacteroidales bacterium]|nr:glycosyltransferase family 39 protein [Bacteroidales bacterium]
MINIDYISYTNNYYALVYIAFSFFILAVLSFEFIQQKRFSILLLSLGSISLFSFVAISYPYLHAWDEQFHALVAKNMSNHFFLPTLVDKPILEIGNRWDDTHIWIHKQPFFLWQIALSIKIFGANTFALRIPDIILVSIFPILIYRIGSIVHSRNLGFYAAILFLTSQFLITLIAGKLNTDHNDLSFIFYVTASFWAWFEYQKSNNRWWLILIGIFSGIAILTKWLVGLIVYAGWGLSILLNNSKRLRWVYYRDLLMSLLITAVVVAPWQIYILWRFPIISRREYSMNTDHFHRVLEGHDGAWNFHIEQWSEHIAPYFSIIIPIAMLIFLFLNIQRNYKIAILSWIIIVTVFFSVAATKMPAFTFILSALFFIIIITPLNMFISKSVKLLIPNNRFKVISLIRIGLAVAAFYYLFSFDTLNNNPDWRKEKWKTNYIEAQTFERIGKMDLPKKSYFYNFEFHGAIRFMFHTDFQARSLLPNLAEIDLLKLKGVSIYVFDDNKLPSYITEDGEITKIKSPIWTDYQNEDILFYQ